MTEPWTQLQYPDSWLALGKAEIHKRIREAPCGPGDGALAMLVPDDILKLDIRPACAIHDHMCSVAKSWAYLQLSHQVYLENILTLISLDHNQSPIRRLLRTIGAYIHYYLVKKWRNYGAFSGAEDQR